MSFSQYLKDRTVPCLIMVVAIALVGLMVWTFSYSIPAVVSSVVVLFIAFTASLVWDYLARRRFYKELEESLSLGNEAFYMADFLDEPSFVEGQLTYSAIEVANKDMNDRIASYHRASDEYREYIETWIHEVKTPIASSRLTLANNPDQPITRPIERDLDRIEAHVEQALYYSRSAAVEKDYLIKKVHLEELIKIVLKKNARTLIEQGITPRFENLDEEVYGDPKWLEFIIGQVIANSIKYHQPKTDEHDPTITFSARKAAKGFESENTILDIADNGIGIPQSDIMRIFEKGFTGENGRRFARSTGIGLYLCKKLCTKMMLKISATSVEKSSTTISIEFPLSKMYFLE